MVVSDLTSLIITVSFRLFQKYNADSGITFATWLMVGIPMSFLTFMLTWVCMQVYALGKK